MDRIISNETLFNAQPGGVRMSGGEYYSINDFGYWWSSDKIGMFESGSIFLTTQGFNEGNNHPAVGISLRCVKG